jgi:hypothetical protein
VAVRWAPGARVVVTWHLGDVAPAWQWWARGAHVVVTWRLGEVGPGRSRGGDVAPG